MSKLSIELNQELSAKVQEHSEAAGYSSPQEFVEHLIEKALAKDAGEPVSEEEAGRKLQGIGYLDFGLDI